MRRLPSALPALAVLWCSMAAAQVPNPSMHFGLFGGYHLVDDQSDLRQEDVDRARRPTSGADFGARIGGQINWLVGLELEVEDALLGVTTTGETAHALNFRGLLILHFLKESPVFQPFGVVGSGIYTLFSEDLGDDADYLLTYGLGARFMLADPVALRVQVNHVIHGDGIDQSVAHNFDFTGGFDFFVSFAEPVVVLPPDRDGDGILDDVDRCPFQSGSPALDGCPDADGDGIADIDDRCVTERGAPQHAGCPDTDADGIPDPDDRCPKLAGTAAFGGCPDTDGDGIADDQDRCPQVKGVAENGGCPAVPKPEVLARFTGAIRGITFETGRATIRPTSFAILDDAVGVLTEFPELRLVIEGHTDARGSDARNLSLSQSRADAVKAYLVARGVEPGRLDAVGFGETRPLASNATETGRAENRRIEFRIVQKDQP